MQDDTIDDTATVKRPSGAMAAFKKLMLTLLVLVSIWVGLRYIAVPIMDKKAGPPPAPVAAIEPAPITEPQIAPIEALPEPAPEPVAEPIVAAPSEEMESRLKALEDKVAALEQAAPGALAPAPFTEPPAPSVTQAEMDALRAEIDALKTQDHAYLRSIILANELKGRIQSGEPFQAELSALESLRPDMKDMLLPLAQPSLIGVATKADLAQQFKVAVDRSFGPKTHTGASVSENLKSMVRIRKIGEGQIGKDDESIIARAEALLAKGEIAASVQEIGTLSNKTAPHFENWVEAARQHLLASGIAAQLGEKAASKQP